MVKLKKASCKNISCRIYRHNNVNTCHQIFEQSLLLIKTDEVKIQKITCWASVRHSNHQGLKNASLLPKTDITPFPIWVLQAIMTPLQLSLTKGCCRKPAAWESNIHDPGWREITGSMLTNKPVSKLDNDNIDYNWLWIPPEFESCRLRILTYLLIPPQRWWG